ncbi:Tad domain-containing protein [Palleronia pelagia]|uniref:Putative Flp pilus-assembly TadE/G-like n=1 Tax=Palleronia pelagia TaxID=387096 RepID=A0A1H8LRU2_9RHOB|nr:Tad domain-containing protein [Palleronia pelagia]SEO07857.1 Putative Flp pilus-assembly TadE/G-like [Palleronia pelagia]
MSRMSPISALRIARFGNEEEGSLTIMALFFFICMVMIGGLSLDIMVFENNRTRLQNLSDRAVLAATAMNQEGDPEAVVRSYFDKAGMSSNLAGIQVSQGLVARTVSVQTAQPMRTMFMNMTGVTQLKAQTNSTAVEGMDQLEVALVLDVSNSMNQASNVPGMATKLDDMKNAAKRFIDVIYDNADQGTVSVTLIPYNTQVNAGRDILEALNVQLDHEQSFCLDFDDTDYGAVAMNTSKAYSQAAHFDQWHVNEQDPVVTVCRSGSNQEIKLHQSDPEVIKAQIDALTAHGNTSSEIGMKWAASLLDPSTKDLVQQLSSNGVVPNEMSNRPLDYDVDGARKVVILLTDGINTEQMRLNNQYKNGMSPVYETVNDGATETYSVNMRSLFNRASGSKDFWAKSDCYLGICWNDTWSQTPTLGWVASLLGLNPNYGQRQLTWQETWETMNPRHLAWHYLVDASENSQDYYDFLDGLWSPVSGATKDTRLLGMCNDMREESITVYTIGFEINDHARDIMGRCASNANTFIDVTGDDLEETFASIATSITRLRLTQ